MDESAILLVESSELMEINKDNLASLVMDRMGSRDQWFKEYVYRYLLELLQMIGFNSHDDGVCSILFRAIGNADYFMIAAHGEMPNPRNPNIIYECVNMDGKASSYIYVPLNFTSRFSSYYGTINPEYKYKFGSVSSNTLGFYEDTNVEGFHKFIGKTLFKCRNIIPYYINWGLEKDTRLCLLLIRGNSEKFIYFSNKYMNITDCFKGKSCTNFFCSHHNLEESIFNIKNYISNINNPADQLFEALLIARLYLISRGIYDRNTIISVFKIASLYIPMHFDVNFECRR